MQGVLCSLGAFFSQLFRPKSRLARALVPLLIAKVAIVLLAKVFVFGEGNVVPVTPERMEQHLTVPAAPTARES